MPVSFPGRDDRAPAGGRYRPPPGNGTPNSAGGRSRAVFGPAVVGFGAGGPGGSGPSGAGQRDPRQGRAGDGAGRSLVRPYAVTGGRTRPRTQLEIEAMVAAAHYEARDLSVLSPECQAILGFCRDWRSVAEISAVLRMPLGVARILIAD